MLYTMLNNFTFTLIIIAMISFTHAMDNKNLEVEKNNECPICYETLQNTQTITLPCAHMLCAKCCFHCLIEGVEKCPICRDLKLQEIFSNFSDSFITIMIHEENYSSSKLSQISHSLALFGKIEICKHLVYYYNLDINLKNEKGNTILHSILASLNMSSEEKYKVFKLFVEDRNADMSIINSFGESFLHYAAKISNIEILEYILEKSVVPIDVVDIQGNTFLIHLLYSDSTEEKQFSFIKFIFPKYYPNVFFNNDHKISPCFLALTIGYFQIFDYFVQQTKLEKLPKDFLEEKFYLHKLITYFGPAISEEEKLTSIKFLIETYHVSLNVLEDFKSVVHKAACLGYLQILDYLLQFVNIDLKDDIGSTALFDVIMSEQLFFEEKISVIEFLIKKGADANARDKFLLTPLTLCIVSPHIDLTKYLIKHKEVDVNVVDNQGIAAVLRVILSENSDSDNLEILEYFLEDKSVNISEAKTPEGCNALHLSANLGKLKIMDYLVENTNLSLSDIDSDDNSVLSYVISAEEVSEKAKIKIIRHFYEKFNFSEINDAVHDCMIEGYYKIAKYLFQTANVDINLKYSDGSTVINLLLVSEMDETKKLKFLKLLTGTYDAKLFVEKNFETETTLLHLCAHFGFTKILRYLVLEKKMDVNQRDFLGRTPLMVAVGSLDMNRTQTFLTVQCLVEKLNADLSPTNVLGDSVVMVSQRLEIFSVYQYLNAEISKNQQHRPRNKASTKPLSILDIIQRKHK